MGGALKNIEQFKELLLKACGHQFADERERTLVGAISQRMEQRQITAAAHYYSLLQVDQEELQQLIDLLTVNETYFLREPDYLRLVVDRIVPELLRDRQDEPVRIVCAGCATGEEPYSLAMLLDQRYGAASRRLFVIAAADIDATAIAVARRAVYGQGSFRGDIAAYRDRYFTPLGPDSWQLGEVREQVHFEVLNLLSDSYPTAFQRPDIILYRNVSIYFPSQVQGEIFSRLADQLRIGGCLLVGATETMHHNLGILHLVEQDSLFFFRKRALSSVAVNRRMPDDQAWSAKRLPSEKLRGGAKPDPSRPPRGQRAGMAGRQAGAVSARKPGVQATGLSELFAEALALARSQQPDQALSLLERIIAADGSYSRAYALKGSILAEMDRFTEVQSLCRTALQHDPLCLEACLLLGVSARHQGDNDEAGQRFREALYVNRACWPAHFYLAEIAYAKGEAGPAKREYQSTLEVLEKQDGLTAAESFFPLSFNPSHLISVCRHKLSLMDG